MAGPNPYQDTGAYHEPFGQQPALYARGWETVKGAKPPGFRSYAEPQYTPGSQTAPYGTDHLGSALHGPLPFQDYYPDPTQRPAIDINRDWMLDTPKFTALGFRFDAKLGSGSFGEVWRVTHTDANGQDRQMAAKILLTRTLFYAHLSLKDIINEMLNDLTALRGLQHPSLVCIESVVHIRDESTGFPSLFVVVFMELCDGCLTEVVIQSPNDCFNEQQAREWFRQIADGLLYLHQHQVVHQDLKPDNILYKSVPGQNQIHYKLADFGLSQVFAPNQPMKSKSYGGTPFYMPPETQNVANTLWSFVNQVPVIDLKAMDVYSLAVSLAETLIGYTVDPNLYVNMISLTPGLDFNHWINDLLIRSGKFAANHPVIDLLSRMTESDPTLRLRIEQVLHHPWVTGVSWALGP